MSWFSVSNLEKNHEKKPAQKNRPVGTHAIIRGVETCKKIESIISEPEVKGLKGNVKMIV
jgi:hypothetical protein